MPDIRVKYGTQVTVTIGLGSLASQASTAFAGRTSAVQTVSTNNDIDHLLSGKIRVNTTTGPTAGNTIEIWAYGQIDDTPTYPDSIDGTDKDLTITSANVLNSGLRYVATITVDATTGRTYPVAPTSIASVFGGVMPKRWGIWVVNRSGQTLSATSSDHSFVYLPVQYQTV